MYAIRITPAPEHLFAGEFRLVKRLAIPGNIEWDSVVATHATRAAANAAIAKLRARGGNVTYNLVRHSAPANPAPDAIV